MSKMEVHFEKCKLRTDRPIAFYIHFVNIADKDLSNCEEVLQQSNDDVETLSRLVDEFTEPERRGCLDADENLYLGKEYLLNQDCH